MYAGICSERVATIDLSARMSVFLQAGCIPASICLPKQKGRKGKKKEEKKGSSLGLDWLPSLSLSPGLSILPHQLKPLFTAPVPLSS